MISRLRIAVLCSALLFLASIAAAETIRFDPPNATAHHAVDAIVSGNWPNGCVPSVKSVTFSGSTIQLRLNARPPLGVLCTQSVTAYTRTFHLDVLPAGSYMVVLLADYGDSATELARTTLVVRDTETLSIAPYAVPTTGGQIILLNPFYLASASITIGGVTVPADSSTDGALVAEAPPHVAGGVDVIVTSTAGSVSSKAALIYYDPASADPAVFEPILFPLSFQGPGAFGSQWTTESFLYAYGSHAFFRDPLPCIDCSVVTSFFGSRRLINNSNPWGYVLYAMRGTADSLDFASRIRDTSRQAQTAGTEVPIARERDFRGQLRLMNIPVDARYRTTLRLWSLSSDPLFIVTVDSTPAQQVTVSMKLIPGTSISFGSIDVTPLLTKADSNPTNVTVSPIGTSQSSPAIWGMLSLTNNDTQQVTIVSPQ